MTASSEIQVEVQGPLIVTAAGFCAVYYKPKDQPQQSSDFGSRSDDYELLARAGMAANDKARELGLREGDYPDAPPSSPQNPVQLE